MDEHFFALELEQISALANLVLENEPSLTRYEALQIAIKIVHHDQKGDESADFHIKMLDALECIKDEIVRIKISIYESA